MINVVIIVLALCAFTLMLFALWLAYHPDAFLPKTPPAKLSKQYKITVKKREA